MAGGKFRRKISLEEIKEVHDLIEQCLLKYMSQQEAAEFILEQAKIMPAYTETIWKKLEEDNPDFFKAYHVKLMLMQQVTVYNSLLDKQMFLMQQPQATGASLNSDSNSSYIPQLQQGSASYAPEHTSQEYMHASIVSRSPSQNMNHTGAAMSARGGRIEATQNMFHPQSLDNCFLKGMNGEIIKQGPYYDVNTRQETRDETPNGVGEISLFLEYMDVDLFSK